MLTEVKPAYWEQGCRRIKNPGTACRGWTPSSSRSSLLPEQTQTPQSDRCSLPSTGSCSWESTAVSGHSSSLSEERSPSESNYSNLQSNSLTETPRVRDQMSTVDVKFAWGGNHLQKKSRALVSEESLGRGKVSWIRPEPHRNRERVDRQVESVDFDSLCSLEVKTFKGPKSECVDTWKGRHWIGWEEKSGALILSYQGVSLLPDNWERVWDRRRIHYRRERVQRLDTLDLLSERAYLGREKRATARYPTSNLKRRIRPSWAV